MVQMASHSSLITASSLGKWPRFFDDLAELVVQRFDAGGGTDHPAQHRRERKERGQAFPAELKRGDGVGFFRPNSEAWNASSSIRAALSRVGGRGQSSSDKTR
jgi:hypothetical protein